MSFGSARAAFLYSEIFLNYGKFPTNRQVVALTIVCCSEIYVCENGHA